jgi:ketosteroid isomerase-like protein
MSQATIDFGERLVAAMNAREISDGLAEELLAPDFRLANTSTAVSDTTYHGAGGVRKWISDMLEAFDEGARVETEQILADGDDFVVARLRIVGHGARSGAPLVLRWVAVCWFRDGKMTRGAGYLRRHEALKAVGLEE